MKKSDTKKSEISSYELFKKLRSIFLDEQLGKNKRDRDLEEIYEMLKKRDRGDIYEDALESALKEALLYEEIITGMQAKNMRSVNDMADYELLEILSESREEEGKEKITGTVKSKQDYLFDVFGINDNIFICNVEGESMTGASIFDGDTLIVEKKEKIKNGDIVVADVKGELFVKKFKHGDDKIKFISENREYPTYEFDDESPVKILGVVKRVIHKV